MKIVNVLFDRSKKRNDGKFSFLTKAKTLLLNMFQNKEFNKDLEESADLQSKRKQFRLEESLVEQRFHCDTKEPFQLIKKRLTIQIEN